MKSVPKTGRAAWHEKAMDAAKDDDLQSLIELFIETKEMKRLAELVRGAKDEVLEKMSHYATEPAAKKLEKAEPGLAARLWRAQGMRIVNKSKSQYYDAALANFESARRCYERAASAANGRTPFTIFAPTTAARPASCPGLRRWPRARAARPSLRFWSAPKHAGACGTGKTIHEEEDSNSSRAPVGCGRTWRTHR
jgi:uncharacterized membrane protein YccC